jgi:hypothetical protein
MKCVSLLPGPDQDFQFTRDCSLILSVFAHVHRNFSIVRNKDYLHLHLFYESGNVGLNSHHQSYDPAYPNIDFINLSNTKYRDFATLISMRLCIDIFPHATRMQCERLRSSAKKTVNLMVQLRGVYGRIFEPWINNTNCKTWYKETSHVLHQSHTSLGLGRT